MRFTEVRAVTETLPNKCALCGNYIKPEPVDGTDPADSEGEWTEIYECENGHTGRMHWEAGKGIERFGAIADEVTLGL
jgi:hypothetical protein